MTVSTLYDIDIGMNDCICCSVCCLMYAEVCELFSECTPRVDMYSVQLSIRWPLTSRYDIDLEAGQL